MDGLPQSWMHRIVCQIAGWLMEMWSHRYTSGRYTSGHSVFVFKIFYHFILSLLELEGIVFDVKACYFVRCVSSGGTSVQDQDHIRPYVRFLRQRVPNMLKRALKCSKNGVKCDQLFYLLLSSVPIVSNVVRVFILFGRCWNNGNKSNSFAKTAWPTINQVLLHERVCVTQIALTFLLPRLWIQIDEDDFFAIAMRVVLIEPCQGKFVCKRFGETLEYKETKQTATA